MKRVIICALLAVTVRAIAAPAPKALVVMLDGFRADAVENACAPNMQRLVAGKWQPGYGCAWSFTAKTVLRVVVHGEDRAGRARVLRAQSRGDYLGRDGGEALCDEYQRAVRAVRLQEVA